VAFALGQFDALYARGDRELDPQVQEIHDSSVNPFQHANAERVKAHALARAEKQGRPRDTTWRA